MEVEFKIRDLSDLICEQSIGSLTGNIPDKPEAQSINEVCTVRGYFCLWALGMAYCCLSQAPITGFDTVGRREWMAKALGFVNEELGFSKAKAFLQPRIATPLSIQLWDWTDSAT